MIGILGEYDLEGMVLTQPLNALLQRIVNILFKIFIHGAITAVHTGNHLVEQDQFFLGQGIDDLAGIITAIQEMGDDDIMGVLAFFIMDKPFKKSEINILAGNLVKSGIYYIFRFKSPYNYPVNIKNYIGFFNYLRYLF